MEQLVTATKNIDQSSAQIVSIIKTIEDIALQTNILALNASVEAGRAGEAGKEMDEISLTSSQQAEMIVSVENRIKEVSRVVQANSSAVEESAAVSNELSNQARTLNRLIGQFRIR